MDDLVFYYPQGHESHFEAGHPERPERVEAIRLALEEVGLWEKYPHLQPVELPDSILHGIHAASYLEALEKICQNGMHYDADTYTRPASWKLAINAAGGAAAVAKAVWRGESKRVCPNSTTRSSRHPATRNGVLFIEQYRTGS
jgi:acetoin utilization deacetylase AcuC-like enzyme